jgi:hypothetical protein
MMMVVVAFQVMVVFHRAVVCVHVPQAMTIVLIVIVVREFARVYCIVYVYHVIY